MHDLAKLADRLDRRLAVRGVVQDGVELHQAVDDLGRCTRWSRRVLRHRCHGAHAVDVFHRVDQLVQCVGIADDHRWTPRAGRVVPPQRLLPGHRRDIGEEDVGLCDTRGVELGDERGGDE
jgi:hypothetical protein